MPSSSLSLLYFLVQKWKKSFCLNISSYLKTEVSNEKIGFSLQQQLTGTHQELQQSIQKLAQVVKTAAEEAARGIKELENSKQAIRQLIALLGDASKPGLSFLSLSLFLSSLISGCLSFCSIQHFYCFLTKIFY
jgi:outer membrane murein-binding lipoprotein Lpp